MFVESVSMFGIAEILLDIYVHFVQGFVDEDSDFDPDIANSSSINCDPTS